MHGKQRGFTLIEILVVITIIGVLASLVVVIIPRAREKAARTDCANNIHNLETLLEQEGTISKFPAYSGANELLYLVKKGVVPRKADDLKVYFCADDKQGGVANVGGPDVYKNLDLQKNGQYDSLTSYACRDFRKPECSVLKTESGEIIVCDESFGFHKEGINVGLTGGRVVFKDKTDTWGMDADSMPDVGEGSNIKDLKCLRKD